MSYTLEKHNDVTVLTVDDLWNPLENQEIVAAVEEKITEGDIEFVIDLQPLEFMNSSGLSFLISILTRARNAGGEVVIANVSEKIKQVLLIARLNSMFTVCESLDEGLAHFQKAEK